jgi:hypothetical protein
MVFHYTLLILDIAHRLIYCRMFKELYSHLQVISCHCTDMMIMVMMMMMICFRYSCIRYGLMDFISF